MLQLHGAGLGRVKDENEKVNRQHNEAAADVRLQLQHFQHFRSAKHRMVAESLAVMSERDVCGKYRVHHDVVARLMRETMADVRQWNETREDDAIRADDRAFMESLRGMPREDALALLSNHPRLGDMVALFEVPDPVYDGESDD